MTDISILWRRLDHPGHESARLSFQTTYWHLAGTAVFAHNQQACRLDYLVLCDSDWKTTACKVEGWVGINSVQVELNVDADQRWWLNKIERPALKGCIDVDLNFSPSTNLLPIRRLQLGLGEEAIVTAAWLRFPTFILEPLKQKYRRTGEKTYSYESAGGTFSTEIKVNQEGFVTEYPGIWEAELAF